MSNPRPFIIRVLEEEFKDPTKAKEICNATLETLTERPGSASRIFDKLPSLLPKETIEHLAKKCLNILSNMEVHSVTYDTNGIDVHNRRDQENITLLIKEIASIGINELLDNNGHIKIELIKLLQLENIKNKLGRSELTISILCGYIGAINQEIAVHFSKEILALNPAYTGFSGYLNKKTQHAGHLETNVRQWVMEKLHESGYVFYTSISNKNTDPNILLSWPNETQTADSLMVLSAITKASSTMFFKKNAHNNTYLTIDNMKKNGLN